VDEEETLGGTKTLQGETIFLWEEHQILISVLMLGWTKSTGAAAGGGDSSIYKCDGSQTVKTEEQLKTLIHLYLQQDVW